MNLILRQLSLSDSEAFNEGLALFSDMESFWYTFTWVPGMSHEEHLKILDDEIKGLNLEPHRVPGTMLYAFLEGKIVGRCNIRHELNEHLKIFGGHIGYSVATPYRNRGIASEILKQSLEYCRNKLKLEKVLLTCNNENIGSNKTIEKNGGILENTIYNKDKDIYTRRYWINLT